MKVDIFVNMHVVHCRGNQKLSFILATQCVTLRESFHCLEVALVAMFGS